MAPTEQETNAIVEGLKQKVMEHMVAAQAKAKLSQREALIEAEVAKYKNAATKRNVGHNMKLLGKVSDMEELVKCEEGEDFVSADNIEAANETINQLFSLLTAVKDDIQHEIDMQIVAATSELGWQTVRTMEGGLELSNVVSVASIDVRKAEKETISFNRDLRSAKNSKKRKADSGEGSGSRRGRGRGGSRGARRGRGGAISSERSCWKCGSTDHVQKDCDK